VQWSDEMMIWIVLGGLGALALAIYLLYALLNAEKF
jgi:K+-transporting ATPase KdpF subunit